MSVYLITNKHIRDLRTKPSLSVEDANLLRLGENCKESEIQQLCHMITNALSKDYQDRLGKKVIEFIQNDNGDTSAGSLSKAQRIGLFKRKKREGTKAGFPDVAIIFGTPDKKKTGVIFFEFKRIGSESMIKISEEQRYYHQFLNDIGFDSYITNSPNFFKIILEDYARKFYLEYL